MGFTTQVFFFVFLPASLLAYYGTAALEKWGKIGAFLQKIRLRDVVLVLVGLAFYGWTWFGGIFRILLYVMMVYLFGLLTDACRRANWCLRLPRKAGAEGKRVPLCRVLPLVLSLVVLSVLIYSKYWGQVVAIWNWLFRTEIVASQPVALVGISFITFSAISYLVDLARGDAAPGSLLDCALYFTFFPKVISGPTVLWKDFSPQIPRRNTDFEGVYEGINRIMIGFVKKLLLADTLGACVASIPATGIDMVTAWGSAFLYMLQIYYDFAGYSDIAIGLSRLFGFSVKENFNFPYLSSSIGEFWRRWHISLGAWFRQYVYFPLGGSRKGLAATLRNLSIVFLLTGIWHGNGWNYLVWGGINGICVVAERLLSKNRAYNKTPQAIKWLFTMAVTLVCWEFFRFGSLDKVLQWGKVALGLVSFTRINTWQYYFDTQIVVLALVGALGATVLGMDPVQKQYQRLKNTRAGFALHQMILVLLFAVAILFMVSSTYSPFIYFQY